MNRPVFGPDRQHLGSINVTRLLDRLTQPESLDEELAIFLRAIRKCWQGQKDQ